MYLLEIKILYAIALAKVIVNWSIYDLGGFSSDAIDILSIFYVK